MTSLSSLFHAACIAVLSATAVVASSNPNTCKLPRPALRDQSVPNRLRCPNIPESLDRLTSELTQGQTTAFSGDAIFPDNTAQYEVAVDGSYSNYTYPTRINPSFFVFAETETDVQASVIFAEACGYTVSIRSGGHSYLSTSSCDGTLESPCLLIDVGRMNQKSAEGSTGRLVLGPGVLLEDLAMLLEENGMAGDNIFVPVGGCSKVALGGHIQTGGFGVWSRQLGSTASKVSAFRIVLSNGAVAEVTKPSPATSALNDDLFYAVLGGASGSWGVITEITIDADMDLAGVYWRTIFVWDTEGVAKLFRKLGEQSNMFSSDSRWSFQLSAFGLAPAGQPNLLRIEGTWVAPEAEFPDYDYRFFQDILDACDTCAVISSSNVTERPSESLLNSHLAALDGYEFPDPFRHYNKIWQQTSSYPSPDAWEALARKLGVIMPTPSSPYLFFSQPSFGSVGDIQTALPWPDAVLGANFDIFVPAPQLLPVVRDISLDFSRFLIDLFGEDNRMYWGAYEEADAPIDIIEESGKYFDSPDKFERLRLIKRCVDKGNLFRNSMSMPPANTNRQGLRRG